MKQLAIFQSWRYLALFCAVALGIGQAACTYKKVNNDPVPNPTPVVCTTPAAISYSTHVWPILKKNCRDDCHNPQSAPQYKDFNMDDFSQVKYWSTTKPSPTLAYSWLVGNIRHESGYVFMPSGRPKLSDCDIAIIEAWVAAGTLNN